MVIIGFVSAILIGISLGLIGGGGSILTVPVLVYLFHIDPILASTYSLFVVGTTSVFGSVSYFKQGNVQPKTVLLFGIPSIFSVYLTRTFLLPAIPSVLFSVGNFSLTKEIMLMVLFAVLMIAASVSMIRKSKEVMSTASDISYSKVMLQGFVIGILTGLVGAGGGFLIIPALVKLLKVPIKSAIGTSLAIIAVNALMGFTFSLAQTTVDWKFLFTITSIAIAGVFVGSYLATKVDGKKLKPAFGWFVLVMGIYILLKETLFN